MRGTRWPRLLRGTRWPRLLRGTRWPKLLRGTRWPRLAGVLHVYGRWRNPPQQSQVQGGRLGPWGTGS